MRDREAGDDDDVHMQCVDCGTRFGVEMRRYGVRLYPRCASCGRTSAAIAQARDEGAVEERAKVVAWHRSEAARFRAEAAKYGPGKSPTWLSSIITTHDDSVTCIERGEHLK